MKFNRKSLAATHSTDAQIITVAQAKRHIRGVPGNDDDEIIAEFILSATEFVKDYLQVGLRTQTLTLTMDGFYEGEDIQRWRSLGGGTHTGSIVDLLGGYGSVDLPYPPIQSVTSVTTYDRDDTATVFPASKYRADLRSGRLYLNEGEVWPTNLRDYDAVEIVYVAGYGAESVPEPIKGAIRELVRASYDGCAMELSEATKAMLSPYKRLDNLAW